MTSELISPQTLERTATILLANEPETKISTRFLEQWKNLAQQLVLEGDAANLKQLLTLLQHLTSRYPHWKPVLYNYAGKLAFVKGLYERAANFFEIWLTAARQNHSVTELVEALLALSDVLMQKKELGRAEPLLHEAYNLSYTTSFSLHYFMTLNQVGRYHFLKQSPGLSRQYLEQALSYYHSQFVPGSVDTFTAASLELESATTRYWLAQVHTIEKRRQPAATLLEECLQLRRRHKDILGEMEVLLQLAVLAQQVKDWQTALLYLEKILPIAISLNHLPMLLRAYVYDARVQYYLNRYWKSFISARRALTLALQLKESDWLARTYFIMAELKDRQDDHNAALGYHLKAASLYPSNDPNPEWIEPLLGSGDYLLSKSDNAADWEQALRCYTVASDIIEANQELEYLAPALGKMARAFLKVKGLNGLDQAARCYRIELMLAGDLESVVLPVAQAVQLRVEALTGIQRCAALRQNTPGELIAG